MSNTNNMIAEYKTIINFLEKARVDHLEFFSQSDFIGKKTMVTKLYEKIREHEFKDLNELETAMYGSAKKSSKFKKLISKFQNKLTNTLFFIDSKTPLLIDRAKAHYLCARRTVLVRILLDRDARKLAIKIAEITLPIALKYEFTDLCVYLSKALTRHYIQINSKNFHFFKTILKNQIKIQENELSVELFAREIEFEITSAKGNPDQNINLDYWRKKVSESIVLINESPTIEILINCSIIIFEFFKVIRDFKKYREYTFILLDKILTKPFLSQGVLGSIIAAQLRNTMIIKDKNTAFYLEKSYFDMLKKGTHNWYTAQYFFILTLFHSKEYQKGLIFLEYTMRYDTFQKQSKILHEAFYILQAFANFLIKVGKVKAPDDLMDFRLNKFMNQVPDHSRDKQRINISIILVQILILLADKKYAKIIDRIESLNLYSYRHLKKDENLRSQCFIKMLSEMVKAGFKKQGTLFRTEKILNKLKATPIETFPAAAEREVIPYEDLWEIIIERLD